MRLAPLALLFSTVAGLLGSSALAYHNYSPICTTAVADMQISVHSTGPDTTMGDWKVSIAKAATTGQFVVTASGTAATYGLVLRVQDAATSSPTGTFIGTVPSNLKIMATTDGTSCGPSVITHTGNPASSSISATWSAGTFTGNVNISAIVISSGYGQWTVVGTNAKISADGTVTVLGATATAAATTLQGIMQYRVYIIAAGCALGIMAIAMVVRIAIKRQQNSTRSKV